MDTGQKGVVLGKSGRAGPVVFGGMIFINSRYPRNAGIGCNVVLAFEWTTRSEPQYPYRSAVISACSNDRLDAVTS